MHQAVLVHAQVHKRAKLRHIAYRAFERHAFFQVFDVLHALGQAGHFEVGAGVAARFFQFTQNVLDGDEAKLFAHQLGRHQRPEQLRPAHDLFDRFGGFDDDLLNHRVGFGVQAGHVQGVVAAANAQKTRALLKRLGSEARHLEQVLPGLEHAVFVAPTHHRFGHRGRQARDPAEQGHAGRVQVHADRVHTVFHHRQQGFGQFALVHIVLVLAHANGFGVDLDQLGQRVLQAPRNGGRPAQAHVHIGHLLRRELAGRVNRSARLAHHHFLNVGPTVALGQLLDQVTRQFVGFAAGRAVANGNQVHAMLFAKFGQGVQ